MSWTRYRHSLFDSDAKSATAPRSSFSVLGGEVFVEAWEHVCWAMADTLIDLESQLYAAAEVRPGDTTRSLSVLDRLDDPAGAITRTVAGGIEFATAAGRPGQYVSVTVPLPGDRRQKRQYSITAVTIDTSDVRLSFTVRPVRQRRDLHEGTVSNWIADNVRPGDRLEVSLPFGALADDLSASLNAAVLVSSGIGITLNHPRFCAASSWG